MADTFIVIALANRLLNQCDRRRVIFAAGALAVVSLHFQPLPDPERNIWLLSSCKICSIMLPSVPASSARYRACGVKWIRLHLFLRPAACCGLKRHQQRREREQKNNNNNIVMGATQWAETVWIEIQGSACPLSRNLTLRHCYQVHTLERKMWPGKVSRCQQTNSQTQTNSNKKEILFFLSLLLAQIKWLLRIVLEF